MFSIDPIVSITYRKSNAIGQFFETHSFLEYLLLLSVRNTQCDYYRLRRFAEFSVSHFLPLRSSKYYAASDFYGSFMIFAKNSESNRSGSDNLSDRNRLSQRCSNAPRKFWTRPRDPGEKGTRTWLIAAKCADAMASTTSGFHSAPLVGDDERVILNRQVGSSKRSIRYLLPHSVMLARHSTGSRTSAPLSSLQFGRRTMQRPRS